MHVVTLPDSAVWIVFQAAYILTIEENNHQR